MDLLTAPIAKNSQKSDTAQCCLRDLNVCQGSTLNVSRQKTTQTL